MSVPKILAPAVAFDNICLTFEGKVLFENLTFSVGAGKCTCILGPSGCGKSTLLKLVSGMSIPYSGNITFSSTNHGIGWMSQDDLLLPWMNLIDNVMLGAKLRGEITKELVTKAQELLNEAGLSQYEKTLPAKLSGGMRQRGALLRTLMEERPLLLMDEPFSALDALTRLKLQNLAAKMTKGKTVLLVTHDPMEALRMGDDILVLSGEPIEVNRFATLPGAPPRAAGEPQLSSLYSELLAKLMDEGMT